MLLITKSKTKRKATRELFNKYKDLKYYIHSSFRYAKFLLFSISIFVIHVVLSSNYGFIRISKQAREREATQSGIIIKNTN